MRWETGAEEATTEATEATVAEETAVATAVAKAAATAVAKAAVGEVAATATTRRRLHSPPPVPSKRPRRRGKTQGEGRLDR